MTKRTDSDQWFTLREMSEFDDVREWAVDCLKILEPYRGSGRIYFFGQPLQDDSSLFSLLESVADPSYPFIQLH